MNIFLQDVGSLQNVSCLADDETVGYMHWLHSFNSTAWRPLADTPARFPSNSAPITATARLPMTKFNTAMRPSWQQTQLAHHGYKQHQNPTIKVMSMFQSDYLKGQWFTACFLPIYLQETSILDGKQGQVNCQVTVGTFVRTSNTYSKLSANFTYAARIQTASVMLTLFDLLALGKASISREDLTITMSKKL